MPARAGSPPWHARAGASQNEETEMPFDAKPPKPDIEKVAEVLAPPVLDNVELLAQDLERSETFDIGIYSHDCGTPACIAGHAVMRWPEIADPEYPGSRQLAPCFERFAAKLDVDEGALSDICLWWDKENVGAIHAHRITNKMAAAALRRLRDTGEARFDLADA
jgi:hypothetical protein